MHKHTHTTVVDARHVHAVFHGHEIMHDAVPGLASRRSKECEYSQPERIKVSVDSDEFPEFVCVCVCVCACVTVDEHTNTRM
jgi:hypothetical protein